MTRPEPEAARSADAFRQRGHTVVPAPLIRIAPVEAVRPPGPWAEIVVTSANALIGLANQAWRADVAELPVIAVGDRSAEAARTAGFATVASAGGAARDLVAAVREKYVPGQRLLYLAGADRVTDLAADLAASGLAVDTCVVYRAVTAATLPAPARAALAAGDIDGVLHYSRRTADAYLAIAAAADLTDKALAPLHFCLSERIAEPLAAAGAGHIRIAAKPTEAFLLQLVDSA
jgi:uroporphyrinogen-III synthase